MWVLQAIIKSNEKEIRLAKYFLPLHRGLEYLNPDLCYVVTLTGKLYRYVSQYIDGLRIEEKNVCKADL